MWCLVVDAADGRAYHWNEATGETRWDAPPPAQRETTGSLAPVPTFFCSHQAAGG